MMDFTFSSLSVDLKEEIENAIKSDAIIFITGRYSVGKSVIAKRMLESNRTVIYSFIDCNIEALPSKLYAKILNDFAKELNSQKLREKVTGRTVGAREFRDMFPLYKNQANRKAFSSPFVLFDKVELLAKSGILDCLFVLSQIDGLRLMCITDELVAEVINQFKSATQKMIFYDRITQINVPNWSQDQMIEYVTSSRPKQHVGLYTKFVKNVANLTCNDVTNDPIEIKMFCQKTFPDFINHYRENVKALMRKQNNDSDISDDEDLGDLDVQAGCDRLLLNSFLVSYKEALRKRGTRGAIYQDEDRKMVFGITVLLLAAFIASSTRPTDDQRNFVRLQRKKVSRATNPSDGARTFTLERLLHIFDGLIRLETRELDVLDCTDSVLSDVKLLQDYNLLSVTKGNGMDADSLLKLQDSFTREFADILAARIGLNLNDLHGLPLP